MGYMIGDIFPSGEHNTEAKVNAGICFLGNQLENPGHSTVPIDVSLMRSRTRQDTPLPHLCSFHSRIGRYPTT